MLEGEPSQVIPQLLKQLLEGSETSARRWQEHVNRCLGLRLRFMNKFRSKPRISTIDEDEHARQLMHIEGDVDVVRAIIERMKATLMHLAPLHELLSPTMVRTSTKTINQMRELKDFIYEE